MKHARLMGRWAGFLALVAAVLAAPIVLHAQDDGPLRLDVRPSDGGVDASLVGVLAEGGTQSSLASGLPVRLLVVVELWQDRFFDSQRGRFEWRATVRLDPLAEMYRVETAGGVALTVGSLEEVESFFAGSPEIPLVPRGAGRFYYIGRLEVETLSASDLDELGRWLRGDLNPDGSDVEVGSAIGRGIRTLFVRALGLPVRRFETRTRGFDRE